MLRFGSPWAQQASPCQDEPRGRSLGLRAPAPARQVTDAGCNDGEYSIDPRGSQCDQRARWDTIGGCLRARTEQQRGSDPENPVATRRCGLAEGQHRAWAGRIDGPGGIALGGWQDGMIWEEDSFGSSRPCVPVRRRLDCLLSQTVIYWRPEGQHLLAQFSWLIQLRQGGDR
jgi:hypothetical protein